MNIQSAVQQQLGFWYGALGQMLSDCSEEALNRNLPDATVTSIGSIYAHTLFGEDTIVNALLQGKPVLYQSDGWEAKTGVPFPGIPPAMNPEWGRGVRMNLPSFQEYAQAVRSATDAYLTALSDTEIDRKTEHFGGQTVGWILVSILATHAPQHAGEIAALKGVQGLKGLPF